MKESKLLRPKNSFVPPSFQRPADASIISDDPAPVVRQQLKALIELHQLTTADSGYRWTLAYRVILLCLTSDSQEDINLPEQISHFIQVGLQKGQLGSMQLCLDVLLLKETKQILKEECMRLFKVRLLRGLRGHYRKEGNRGEGRKCGSILEEYCKASLGLSSVRLKTEIYEQILDAMIQEMKNKVGRLVVRGDSISATEKMGSLVGVLEKSDRIATGKYQAQLMQAYWALARLHHQLHYLAYTRKYAAIALNIAQRIQHPPAVQQLTALLEQLA